MLGTEKLSAKENSRNRAVCNAAEKAGKSDCRTEREIKPQYGRKCASEGCAYEKDRHNLAALEACAERQRGEDYLQQDAMSDDDSYASLKKQNAILDLVMSYYKKTSDALAAGAEGRARLRPRRRGQRRGF